MPKMPRRPIDPEKQCKRDEAEKAERMAQTREYLELAYSTGLGQFLDAYVEADAKQQSLLSPMIYTWGKARESLSKEMQQMRQEVLEKYPADTRD